MGDLTISMNSQMDTTVVSNQFIDDYMPSANGEYVKIYLYILRCVNHHASTFSIEEMAQRFDHTVSYILNALRYWETMQLLQLQYDENNSLKHITFLDLTHRSAASAAAGVSGHTAALPADTQTKDTHAANAQAAATQTTNVQTREVHAADEAAATQTADAQMRNVQAPDAQAAAMQTTDTQTAGAFSEGAAQKASVPDLYRRHTYSLEEKHRFAKDKNFNSAKFITQTYFGKPLGPSQMDILMFIYDGLGFDNDLIDYLVEYCFSKGKRSMRYIEATAIAWAKEGIQTAAQAKERQRIYSQLTVSVMKELGISSRSLVPEERAALDLWVSEYHMPDALILEACRRTIRATGKPSFDYAGSILSDWNKRNIHTPEAVQAADEAHRQKQAAENKAAGKKAAGGRRKKDNAPFPQREYDMVSLERDLLHFEE